MEIIKSREMLWLSLIELEKNCWKTCVESLILCKRKQVYLILGGISYANQDFP
jgi:hypothetical protein